MDWRAYLATLVDLLERLPAPKWLGSAAIFIAAGLLIALGMVAAGNWNLRRRILAQDGDETHAHAGYGEPPAISLEGGGRALVDRVLPSRPRHFLLLVALIAVGVWALGLALATNVSAFLADRDWQMQPLYLATHLITLRLFSTVFTRNFLAGVRHLDLPMAEARHGMRLVVGPVGALIAVAVATPLCVYDYWFPYRERLNAAGPGLATDQLLLAVWCVEWFLTAFIWVLLVGFLFLTRSALTWHRFRQPIEVVLHERQYRPFLHMSAQGATIILGFFIVNAVYVWYTGGEISDYVGAAVTLGLLVIGFLPPLARLRARVSRAVHEEMANLRRQVTDTLKEHQPGAAAGGAATLGTVGERIDEVLVMLRISYLERLYRGLGQPEALNIFVKISVPVVTILWYGYKYLKGLP